MGTFLAYLCKHKVSYPMYISLADILFPIGAAYVILLNPHPCPAHHTLSSAIGVLPMCPRPWFCRLSTVEGTRASTTGTRRSNTMHNDDQLVQVTIDRDRREQQHPAW